MLRGAGLANVRLSYAEAYEPEGVVVGQSPDKGLMVGRDAMVEIQVCRRSLVRFLPSIYQAVGRDNSSLLRRFLFVVQHLMDGVTRKLDDLPELLDPMRTPIEFLPWLGSFIALSLDQDWPEDRRRRFVREAASLFPARGTRRCLASLLELFAGVRPDIAENSWPYRGFHVGVHSVIGSDSVVLPPPRLEHCFVVRLPLDVSDVSESMLARIHEVIRTEKPAHTRYCVQFAGRSREAARRPIMRIGVESTVGAAQPAPSAE
jgi:phage tail-like protein